MDTRLKEMKKRLEDLKKNGTATPEQLTELEELVSKFSSLDDIDAVLKPVLEHFNKLALIPREKQTPQQKLWLLAYSHVDNKFKGGTDNSMLEGALLMPILYQTRDMNI